MFLKKIVPGPEACLKNIIYERACLVVCLKNIYGGQGYNLSIY